MIYQLKLMLVLLYACYAQAHDGPIFSLKWNQAGNYLLSGSSDRSAIVWDVAAGRVQQRFEFHEAPTLDVDWKDDLTFATCSTDKVRCN
jgi:transducin (beta)-like 1